MPDLKTSYPDIDAVLSDMGQPSAEFRPATGTIIGWMVLYGIGLVVGLGALAAAGYMVVANGFELPLFAERKNGPSWTTVFIALASGVSVTSFCGVMLPLKRRELSNRILVYADGFVKAGTRKVDVFRWDEVETILQDYAPADKSKDGPPMTRSTTFLVKRKDGGQYGFEHDSLQNHRQFARLLYAEATARNIPWQVHVT
jgi:hypothetical protein